MTDQEINQRIAEACGWRWYRRPSTGPWAVKPMRCLYHPQLLNEKLQPADMTERECNWAFIKREGCVEDYTTDLNAMHEAEATIESKAGYLRCLWKVVTGKPMTSYASNDVEFCVTCATARQRAEAFIRAKGLLEEDV